MKTFQIKQGFFALMICFIASACSKPLFSVQPLQASNVVMTANSSDPSVAKEMQFTVQACMTNSASAEHNSVANSPFEFVRDGSSSIVQSDEKGCLYWPETVDYNVLDAEHYFKFSRTINGKGGFGGSRTVNFAMDPWKNSDAGFVDLKVTPIDDSAVNNKSDVTVQNAPVFVRTVSVHTYDSETDSSGTSLRAQLNLNPFLTRTGLAADLVREPITRGHFKLELFLLELNKSGNTADTTLLAHNMESVDAEDGVITLLTRFHLSHTPKQDSQIALAFRLTFKVSGQDVTQESMLMMDHLMTQASLTVQDNTQPLDAVVPSTGVTAGAAGSQATTSSGTSTSGFRIDSVNIVSGGVTSTFASTNIAKSVSARITVCLKDSLSLNPVVDHEFQLGLVDPLVSANPDLSSRTSDSAGCLYWQTELNFDGYAAAQWYERSLVVHSSTAPYSDIQQTLGVNLNPSQSGSLYFWDSRNGAPPSVTHANANTPNPGEASLLVKELSYMFTGRDFELDQSMNLVMNRHYQIRFFPMIALKNSYTTEIEDRALENGRLNFKILLMSGQTPLSMYSGSTIVSGGEAVADITLPFEISRFPEVIDRNELILEVSDADQTSKLRSDTLVTPFIAMNASGSSGLQENAQSVAATTSKLTSFRAGTAVTKNLKLTNEQKLTETDLSKMGFTSSAEVQSFINSGGANDTDAAKFCELVFSSIQDIDTCQKNPSAQLQFNVKKPNDGLFGSTTEVSTDIYSLNASASAGWKTSQSTGTTQSYSSGNSVTTGVRASANAALLTGFQVFGNGPRVDAGVGADAGLGHQWSWYNGQSLDRSQGTSHDFSIAKLHSLVVEEMKIQAMTDPGKCLSVSSRNDSTPASIYFCTSPQTGSKVTETWYFVHPMLTVGTMVDGNELPQMSFTSIIRGSANFEKFKTFFQNKNNTVVFDKTLTPPEALREVLIRKYHLDKINSGIIDRVLNPN